MDERPFSSRFVPHYFKNSWISTYVVQTEMTASEPLSLEDEYLMQQRWANDPNCKQRKLLKTMIV